VARRLTLGVLAFFQSDPWSFDKEISVTGGGERCNLKSANAPFIVQGEEDAKMTMRSKWPNLKNR
jgi:hypothetical protein